MRTAFGEIRLFNDTFSLTRQGYILNEKLWGKNKIAERQTERERENKRCCKWVVASVINLAAGENIYDGYRRIILKVAIKIIFSRFKCSYF